MKKYLNTCLNNQYFIHQLNLNYCPFCNIHIDFVQEKWSEEWVEARDPTIRFYCSLCDIMIIYFNDNLSFTYELKIDNIQIWYTFGFDYFEGCSYNEKSLPKYLDKMDIRYLLDFTDPNNAINKIKTATFFH
jgi:hypothetical protein